MARSWREEPLRSTLPGLAKSGQPAVVAVVADIGVVAAVAVVVAAIAVAVETVANSIFYDNAAVFSGSGAAALANRMRLASRRR